MTQPRKFPLQPLSLAQVETSYEKIKKYSYLIGRKVFPSVKREVKPKPSIDDIRDKSNFKLWNSVGDWSPEDELPDEDEV